MRTGGGGGAGRVGGGRRRSCAKVRGGGVRREGRRGGEGGVWHDGDDHGIGQWLIDNSPAPSRRCRSGGDCCDLPIAPDVRCLTPAPHPRTHTRALTSNGSRPGRHAPAARGLSRSRRPPPRPGGSTPYRRCEGTRENASGFSDMQPKQSAPKKKAAAPKTRPVAKGASAPDAALQKTVADNVRQARLALGISQRALARACDI